MGESLLGWDRSGVMSRERAVPNCRSPNDCLLWLGLARRHAVKMAGGRPSQHWSGNVCLFDREKFVREFPSFSYLIAERQPDPHILPTVQWLFFKKTSCS